MQILLNATYKSGALILDERLGIEKEGKKFKVILIEKDSPKVKKEKFFDFIEKHAFTLPKDFKFNREELHDR